MLLKSYIDNLRQNSFFAVPSRLLKTLLVSQIIGWTNAYATPLNSGTDNNSHASNKSSPKQTQMEVCPEPTYAKNKLQNHDINLAESLTLMADKYKEQGNLTLAEPLYQRALAIYKQPWMGENRCDKAICLEGYAGLLMDSGRQSTAEKLKSLAKTIWERLWANYTYAGVIAEEDADLVSAEENFQLALVHAHKLEPQFGRLLSSLDNLAQLYSKQGRYSEAEPLLRQSLAIHEKLFGPDHKKTMVIHERYVYAQQHNHHLTEADFVNNNEPKQDIKQNNN